MRLLLAALFVLSMATVQAHAADDAQVLFNGKDLTGWDGDPQFWSVKDGVIVGQTTAEKPTKGNTFLIWTGGAPKNFELRAMWKMQNHNSGIQYRSKRLNGWVMGGYQSDIDEANTYTGICYEERGRGIIAKVGDKTLIGSDGKPAAVGKVSDPKDVKAAIKKNDWNEYIVICQGNHIIQKINGVVTVDFTDEDVAHRAMEGLIGFQLHAGPPMKMEFKDITLKVLN